MLRKPPGPLFIGAVVAVCAYLLGSSWTVGGLVNEYGLYMFAVLVLAAAVTVVRTFLALRVLPKTTIAIARISAGPILLAISFTLVMFSVPENLRLAYSKSSLDEYARTVTAGSCNKSTFRPIRVGLYTVTCAERTEGPWVAISVRDRLTPNDTGAWYLVGPGDWQLGVED